MGGVWHRNIGKGGNICLFRKKYLDIIPYINILDAE